MTNDSGIEEIVHYTQLDTAFKILESASLWATHYQFLNDIHEVEHGRNLLKNRPMQSECDWMKSAFKAEEKNFEYYFASFSIHKKANPIWPISINDGLLSMWRCYSKDGGCAIVFNSNIGKDFELLRDDESGIAPLSNEVAYKTSLTDLPSSHKKYMDQLNSLVTECNDPAKTAHLGC